jgi:hypothetical protein
MSQTPCGCGRSPTGYCVGWHSLSDDDFDKKIDEYRAANPDLYQEGNTESTEG